MSTNQSAYGQPAGDTDFRRTWDVDEYAAKAKAREAAEREEAKARYEAKLAGKKYHKPLTGNETLSAARAQRQDFSSQIGKISLVPAGAGVGRRGRGAGFYCEACDLTLKDNLQLLEHNNSPEHLANTGQVLEVKRATVEDVVARIDMFWQKRLDEAADRKKTLKDRLEEREAEDEKEREARREKRRKDAERKREKKEEAAKVKTEYGEDVRIDGEHEEEDMMAQMGFAGFGTSKK